VPIYPELMPFLREAFEAAEAGQVNVIIRNRCDNGMKNGASTNWRTQFKRILRKAGVKPWPKLFQNLRSSCQTDLANRFPGHKVCEWMGNAEAVAAKHYLQITDDDYRQAATLQNGAFSVASWTGLERTGENIPRELNAKRLVKSGPGNSGPLQSYEISGQGGT
jgi:hypothetical protein